MKGREKKAEGKGRLRPRVWEVLGGRKWFREERDVMRGRIGERWILQGRGVGKDVGKGNMKGQREH